MKAREAYTCPLELTHDMTKGKWKPILLWQLGKEGAQQPSDLEKSIQGINQKMLLEQLAELQAAGMVEKEAFDGYPLRTEYALTERGRRMLEAITIMQGIGIELMLESGMEDTLRAAELLEEHTKK